MDEAEYYLDVKHVLIVQSEDHRYEGQFAQVMNIEEHKFGVDLRVVFQDGHTYWISSENVVEVED